MFTCIDCHNKSDCKFPHFAIGAVSFGNCEICGERTICADCYFHKYADPIEKKAMKSSKRKIGLL